LNFWIWETETGGEDFQGKRNPIGKLDWDIARIWVYTPEQLMQQAGPWKKRWVLDVEESRLATLLSDLDNAVEMAVYPEAKKVCCVKSDKKRGGKENWEWISIDGWICVGLSTDW